MESDGGFRITIDASTRIVTSDKLTPGRRGRRVQSPIRFERDAILILDPKTRRPIAYCRPIPEAMAWAKSAEPDEEDPGPAINGRLTNAQRALLGRLIAEDAERPDSVVAEVFKIRAGRSLTVDTVARYRRSMPANGKR